jgi:DNA invertase Pin-like site-specific DNA recombinase
MQSNKKTTKSMVNSLTSKLSKSASIDDSDEIVVPALSYEINRILGFNIETNTYIIEWSDKSISNEPVENVSQAAIDAYNIIQSHNNTVMQNCQQQGIQPATQKAYIMIRCSVAKDSSVETQRLALLTFCLQNNILIYYYTVDSGVSGRYNTRTHIMNNLNYEFGYRLPMLTTNNILVINSIDRLGRHATSVMNVITNLMSRNISICVLDIETVITPDNYKTRDMHMKIYELTYKAQELSDEISKRVKNSIAIRKQKNIPLRVKPNLMQNRKFVTETMSLYKKYNKFPKMTQRAKYQRTFDDMVTNENVKNVKFSKTMISKIIKNRLSDNKLTFIKNSDDDDDDADATPIEVDGVNTLQQQQQPAFSITNYLAMIKNYLWT